MSAALIVPLSLIGGYAALSVLLLRFPLLIHRKKQTKINARLIAHRGGAGENLENTLTAYRHALNSGMDMLEIDCQITRDKKIVVSHDNHLERVTGVDRFISDLDYEDLPLICQSIPVHFCKGQTVCGSETDRRIPLLREVFETFPNIPINLDIKRDDDELIHKVLDMIIEYKREDITVVGNFAESVVQKCHQRAPQIPTIMSTRTSVKMLVAFYLGILPFLDFEEEFLEIPMGRELIKNFDVQKRWQKALLWVLDFLLINRVLFGHLQRRGIKVYVWVLNNEAQWDRAMSKRVDGIMTDYPAKLAEYMRRRGYWQDGRAGLRNENYNTFDNGVGQ
ncbi:glycerophosphodiester phosphodiesterase domain-containing protein 1-like isoform X2 [Acanthaster planci]|uniref:Glycerophosphodiester phosphodiesterase domain-containing protein 1-like isoform X2 n=1 Tax=Acanthaster planci TaxID=133434 RepID=A0A8B7Z686_ACAPL|nr:glycerophosphodiester phosphodiesterase domain-containing protein 1-like isoform X2 [Acanthaster planci]